MHLPVSKEINRKNLIDISIALSNIEYFIFFGTLLGVVREGDVIDGDDDVDIYVNIDFRDELIRLIKQSDFFIDQDSIFNKKSNYFVQANRKYGDVVSFVDFYFFEDRLDEEYIVERWNFKGIPDDPNLAIHIPKSFVYPVVNEEFYGVNICLPSDGKAMCQYLYGDDWELPLKKGAQYSVEIIDNAPKIFRRPLDTTSYNNTNNGINRKNLVELEDALHSVECMIDNLAIVRASG